MKKFFFPFCVILNLENFYDNEKQQCRKFGYFTYKHILMKVLPDDLEIMINVFTRSIWVFMNLNAAFFFISKENSSKSINSFSKYKPFKWNFESLTALRPTLLISCLGHYRGLTKCSENKSKIKIAVFNLPTKLQHPVQIAWHWVLEKPKRKDLTISFPQDFKMWTYKTNIK